MVIIADDIGGILFQQILGMTQYPGAPFTGNIYRDLIMFFVIPTIFIILIVYMMVGRVLPPEHSKLRILLGVGAYLFIIAGGFYPAFALLAGPYFVVLIFILGLLFFLFEHFKGKKYEVTKATAGGGGPYPAYGYHGNEGANERAIRHLPSNMQLMLGMPDLSMKQRKTLEWELDQLQKRRDAILAAGRPEKEAMVRLDDINTEIFAIEKKLRGN